MQVTAIISTLRQHATHRRQVHIEFADRREPLNVGFMTEFELQKLLFACPGVPLRAHVRPPEAA